MTECCAGGVKLIYSCSGAADVGEAADRVTRKLGKTEFGRMYCLPAIGAHLSDFVETAKAADLNITIDGCPVACARKSLEHIGVTPKSYVLTEMGLVKGKTQVTEEVIDDMFEKIANEKVVMNVDVRDESSKTNQCGCCR